MTEQAERGVIHVHSVDPLIVEFPNHRRAYQEWLITTPDAAQTQADLDNSGERMRTCIPRGRQIMPTVCLVRYPTPSTAVVPIDQLYWGRAAAVERGKFPAAPIAPEMPATAAQLVAVGKEAGRE